MSATAAAGMHHEVENKLDADSDFVLPDLTGLPGVTAVAESEIHQLEAVYLDSEDLRLARHGQTLRRRQGGPDAGWHLKLPHARTGRIEVRRPLGPSERSVPPQLISLVRVLLRGESVAPVARITTHRVVRRLLGADGVVLAEVADDQVTAEALGSAERTSRWREIEVELVEGDDALLESASAALIAAGARASDSTSKLQRALIHRLPVIRLTSPKKSGKKKPKPTATIAGDVVLAYLSRQVRALIAEDPQVRIEAEDGVHQMRIATRRLRAALATFRPLFIERSTDPLRPELKWLGGLLGAARDAEVIRDALTAHLAAQPIDLVLGPVQHRVDAELHQAHRDAHAQLITALDGDRYLALITALETLVAQPPFGAGAEAPAAEELRSRVQVACARVQKAAAGLVAERPGELRTPAPSVDQDQRLHNVRIAAKRARYAAEVARPVIGKPAKAVTDMMAAIQETLGDHQDAVVERRWLRDLGLRAFLAGENSFTFGRLHGLAEARAQLAEERFIEVWTPTRTVLAAWPGQNHRTRPNQDRPAKSSRAST